VPHQECIIPCTCAVSHAHFNAPQVAQPLVAPDTALEVTIESGPLITEVRQSWAPWASLVTRLWAGADWLDQEWTVGPIPADGFGKEIVVRTHTDMQSGQWMQRVCCALLHTVV
jgi:alpha-mannosidase